MFCNWSCYSTFFKLLTYSPICFNNFFPDFWSCLYRDLRIDFFLSCHIFFPDYIWTSIFLLYLDLYIPFYLGFHFPFLFEVLYPLSIWAFISLLFLDYLDCKLYHNDAKDAILWNYINDNEKWPCVGREKNW